MKTLSSRRALYEPLAEINVTPLVDVMLVLLIVFMITAPMLASGMKVDLPQAQAIAPLDSKGRGKVAAIDVPIECAGVRVSPGDLVLGDADGVVVIPRAVEGEALARAKGKLVGERATLRELQAGASLADVFARHGVL